MGKNWLNITNVIQSAPGYQESQVLYSLKEKESKTLVGKLRATKCLSFKCLTVYSEVGNIRTTLILIGQFWKSTEDFLSVKN